MTRWMSARRAKRKRNHREAGNGFRDTESTASCRIGQTRGGAVLRGRSTPKHLVDPTSSHMLVPAQWASHSEQGTAHLLTKLIPHRGPLARDGTSGQGFAATGLAAASHGQVAISMAEAKARRRRPAPSETEVARVHRQSQRAGPVQRCLRAGKRPAATS